MTALATIDDLGRVMRRALSTDDAARATQLLDIASARVRTFTGRQFTATTETVRLKVRNGKVRLPQSPVADVTAVADMDGNSVSFEWFAGQVVELSTSSVVRFDLEQYCNGIRWVDVTYEHGWAAVPDDVIGIVCDMAAAALDTPPEDAGVQAETLGDYSVTIGSQSPGGVRLTQSMRDALAPYVVRPVATISVS